MAGSFVSAAAVPALSLHRWPRPPAGDYAEAPAFAMEASPMHKHVEWDDPGSASVLRYYQDHPQDYPEPHEGSIISAHFRGFTVRVRVDAHVEDTSIGEVVALIADDNGRREQHVGDLALGDTVRLPDALRALEPRHPEADDDPD
ncbi:hypothetical protein [Halomonas halophila]